MTKLCVILVGDNYSDYRDFKQDLVQHVKGIITDHYDKGFSNSLRERVNGSYVVVKTKFMSMNWAISFLSIRGRGEGVENELLHGLDIIYISYQKE